MKLVLLILSLAIASSLKEKYFEEEIGRVINNTNNLIATISEESKINCLVNCVSNDLCFSVFFDSFNSKCLLFNIIFDYTGNVTDQRVSLYRKKASFNENCSIVGCTPNSALVCDPCYGVCKCQSNYEWDAIVGKCLPILTNTMTTNNDLQNCLLFSCISDCDCRNGIRCINSRCAGLNSTQLRCETNGTVIPVNSTLHRYYFRYPPGGGRNANQSLSDCNIIGANLLSVDSQEELNFIRSVLRSLNAGSGYYIHRYVSSMNGICRFWPSSDPNSSPVNSGCYSTEQYICEYPN